jgi:hypothetical protein
MDFNQHHQLEEDYYCHFQSLNNGLAFFKSLHQDSEESRLTINTPLYHPYDAPSTWSDLFQLCVFPNFPQHLDQFQHGKSIAHVENPDTFKVGHENNKRMLFGCLLARIPTNSPSWIMIGHATLELWHQTSQQAQKG